jgi:hypothetical protein
MRTAATCVFVLLSVCAADRSGAEEGGATAAGGEADVVVNGGACDSDD